jgi:hypothetical protein
MLGFLEPVRAKGNVMRNAPRASSLPGIPEIQKGRWPGFGLLVVLLTEFRRGVAAAQRYETLRYRSACDGRVALADIPRRIFEEFYSSGGGGELTMSRGPARRPPIWLLEGGEG